MLNSHNKVIYKNILNAEKLLNNAIEDYLSDNYKISLEKLEEAHKIFLSYKEIDKVSICLSLTGLIKYISKRENYYKALLFLEDSKFLAESTDNKCTIAVNKFCFGQIYFNENKFNEVLFFLTQALKYLEDFPLLKIKIMESLALTYIKLHDIESAKEFLNQGILLAKNHKINELKYKFEKIQKDLKTKNNNNKESNNKTINKDSVQNNTLILALSTIARTVSTETNIDKLLTTITEQTKTVLNADRCSVFLLDKERNELVSKIALGMNEEEIRFSADKGLAGHVAKTGETINIKDTYLDKRFNSEIDKHTGYRTYNMLCMPIRNIKFEIIGVFQVLNKKNGSFTKADEEILLALGTNAGIAIENNILFNIQQKMLAEQKMLFAGFIDTLAASIDARDKITLGHSNRVRLYSELICRQMGLNKDITEIIARAAMLHDIGKIGIRDSVLQKKGTLTKEEYEHIKKHVKITYDILCKTNLNTSFAEIAEIASSHHEKYDGSGYFRGLKGEEIPLGGRILAVSDVFDAITSVRHYRDRMPMADVLKIIEEGKNKHFDSKVVDAFLSLPCGIITEVLISEFHTHLQEKDKYILSTVTLKKFSEILNKHHLNEKEEKIITIFNSYYIRPKETITI